MSPSKSYDIPDFRKILMGLAANGVGSYTEILETWTLEDYLIWKEMEEEKLDVRNRRASIQSLGGAR